MRSVSQSERYHSLNISTQDGSASAVGKLWAGAAVPEPHRAAARTRAWQAGAPGSLAYFLPSVQQVRWVLGGIALHTHAIEATPCTHRLCMLSVTQQRVLARMPGLTQPSHEASMRIVSLTCEAPSALRLTAPAPHCRTRSLLVLYLARAQTTVRQQAVALWSVA